MAYCVCGSRPTAPPWMILIGRETGALHLPETLARDGITHHKQVSFRLEHVLLKTQSGLHERFCFVHIQGPMIYEGFSCPIIIYVTECMKQISKSSLYCTTVDDFDWLWTGDLHGLCKYWPGVGSHVTYSFPAHCLPSYGISGGLHKLALFRSCMHQMDL